MQITMRKLESHAKALSAPGAGFACAIALMQGNSPADAGAVTTS